MSPTKFLVKCVLLLLVSVAGVAVYRLTPLAGWLEPAGALARWLDQLGAAGVLAFVVTMAVCILVGVPRLLFCPIAGALYGFWSGLALCLAGSMASYYAVFLLLRGREGRPRVALHPRLAFLDDDPGLAGVVLARLLPLPGMVSTVGLSASGVGHRDYLVGSLIGLVPEAVPLILLGTGALQTDPTRIARLAVTALLCVLVSWLLIRHLLGRRSATADVEPT